MNHRFFFFRREFAYTFIMHACGGRKKKRERGEEKRWERKRKKRLDFNRIDRTARMEGGGKELPHFYYYCYFLLIRGGINFVFSQRACCPERKNKQKKTPALEPAAAAAPTQKAQSANAGPIRPFQTTFANGSSHSLLASLTLTTLPSLAKLPFRYAPSPSP